MRIAVSRLGRQIAVTLEKSFHDEVQKWTTCYRSVKKFHSTSLAGFYALNAIKLSI